MTNPPLTDIMSEDWAQALAPVEDKIHAMGEFLRTEHAAGHRTFPTGQNIFRAFSRPMNEVKVLIVGQDPYPTPGNAMGLSFSVQRDMPLPKSLINIYRELSDDLGIEPAQHGEHQQGAEARDVLPDDNGKAVHGGVTYRIRECS